jgi:hypothetical protein
MQRPNIFNFATSELSQDAFLCYLLSWADDAYYEIDSSLHSVAKKFLEKMLDLGGIACSLDSIKIDFIKRQEHQIDILVKINQNILIVIEDKTYSKQHSGQLKKYKNYISKSYSGFKTSFIYFKLLPQMNTKLIEDEGFNVMSFDVFKNILNDYEGKNHIVNEFTVYINAFDPEKRRFQEWTKENWLMFFNSIKEDLDGYFYDHQNKELFFEWNWHRGDFIQINWNSFSGHRSINLKMQTKSGELFMTRYNERRSLLEHQDNFKVQKFNRRNKGKSKVICSLDLNHYFSLSVDGYLDYQSTIKNLKSLSSEYYKFVNQFEA